MILTVQGRAAPGEVVGLLPRGAVGAGSGCRHGRGGGRIDGQVLKIEQVQLRLGLGCRVRRLHATSVEQIAAPRKHQAHAWMVLRYFLAISI